MSLIFVYGTLKRGGNNHYYMAGQRFVAEAKTTPVFRMYELNGYPGIVPDPAAEEGIVGEVWEVDATALARLDELEGLEQGLYQREPVQLAPPFSTEAVQTYVYAHDVSGRREVGPVWSV